MDEGVDRYREDIVRHLAELIRIESRQGPAEPGMPHGRGPFEALRYMLELSRALGFRTVDVDGVCGYAEHGEGDELVCVASHLDVVPEGEGWSRPPFGGTVEDDRIHGRGASDNKSSCVATLFGLAAIRDEGAVRKRRIRVLFGTAEETGMHDLERYVEKEGLPDLAFSPDGGLCIVNGEKGRTRIHLTSSADPDAFGDTVVLEVDGGDAPNRVPESCRAVVSHHGSRVELVMAGRAAHGANPGAGVNAVLRMVSFLAPWLPPDRGLLSFIARRIGRETDGRGLGIACSDDRFGALTLNAGILRHGAEGSELVLDIRYPGTTGLPAIRSALEAAAGPFGVAVRVEEDAPPFYVEKDARIVRLLSQAFREIVGREVEVRTSGGGSYSKVFGGRCVTFGGCGANGHGPDESVGIEELMAHARLCTHAMRVLATRD